MHLQKIYERLIDYEPSVEYNQRLQSVGRILKDDREAVENISQDAGPLQGIRQYMASRRENIESLAMTKVLTNHEEAMQLDSPKGLMLHGEVGTGKSMLIDLFADCLPTQKKRRVHFNTFMLDIYAQLEHFRRDRIRRLSSELGEEHSLIWLSRNLIKTSPILFLDEFQLPDRTAAKLLTNLLTSFFQLGGVLIATSNRMPEELAKAAGMEFIAGQPTLLSSWGHRRQGAQRKVQLGGAKEHVEFLELIQARCDVWELEGRKDYRRVEAEDVTEEILAEMESAAPLADSPDAALRASIDAAAQERSTGIPTFYKLMEDTTVDPVRQSWQDQFTPAQLKALNSLIEPFSAWTPMTLRVYGRDLHIANTANGVARFTFDELCGKSLGPADYITIASMFHTIVLTHVPTLTVLLRNEARRLITLLDAVYEARCKLMISAAAGPDSLFFPELRAVAKSDGSAAQEDHGDGVYPETFSEIYQDLSNPFRPNISSYTSDNSAPDNTERFFQGVTRPGSGHTLAEDALEDDPPNRVWRMTDSASKYSMGFSEFSDAKSDRRPGSESPKTPDFSRTAMFTGEDEKFAYRRAASRLWEMCSQTWWNKAESEPNFWRPLPAEFRTWERSINSNDPSASGITIEARLAEGKTIPMGPGEGYKGSRDVTEKDDEIMFRHNASPFRRAEEPPPKISWTHVWGTVKWGKKAGAWGQGPDGLKERKKGDRGGGDGNESSS